MGKKKVFGGTSNLGAPKLSKKELLSRLKAIGPPEKDGKFRVTCRSCDGTGNVIILGGPVGSQRCGTCNGWGYQYVDTLEPREWMSKRHYRTDIPGVCKDCGSYLGNGKPCKVMKKELDKHRMVLRTKQSDGSTLHSPNHKMVAKPNSTCTEWNERRR